MLTDPDETWFVCDPHAVNMRIELISKSYNPKTSRDHNEKRISFEICGTDMIWKPI